MYVVTPFSHFFCSLFLACFSTLFFSTPAHPKDDFGSILGVDFGSFLGVFRRLFEALAGNHFLLDFGFDFVYILVDFLWFVHCPSKTSHKQRGTTDKLGMLAKHLFLQ